jgi:DNA-binding CsgD family transcriptional regulator
VPGEDVFVLTAAERRRAADMFAGLSNDQWAVRSLCAEWTVRDYVRRLLRLPG